ncbi:MAG: FtsW/RodA/SpoVE family cell cycle protein [Thermotogae bacterium]|nr:FtsW/RodA/SpoVE family cell cycle protein [Thermotogota bacterium]
MREKIDTSKEARGIAFYIFLIIVIGILALYGAELRVSTTYHLNTDLLMRQLTWLIVGGLALIILSFMNPKFHERAVWRVYFFGIIFLLALVLILPSGYKAKRWIEFKSLPIRFQPSELTKLVIVIAIASYISKFRKRMKSFLYGIIIPMILITPVMLLIAFEPDLSTAFLIFIVTLIMLYLGGARLSHILLMLTMIALALILLISVMGIDIIKSYQLKRLREFVDLIAGRGGALQQKYSSTAVGAGGLFGSGIGLGVIKQKISYRESDFIFAVVGEELGIIGSLVMILLYFGLVNSLVKMAYKYVRDTFMRFYVYGFAVLVGVQALIHMCVNVGLLPPTGMTLPFASYGGSSMFTFMAGAGIVFSILLGGSNEKEG